MKQIFLFLLIATVGLAGCRSASNDFVVETEDTEYAADCIGANCAIIHFSSPNGNDLILETDRHIIEIAAQPGVAYSYYVWAGDKETTDDADLIIHNGNAMVLIEE